MMTTLIIPNPALSCGDVSWPRRSPESQMKQTHSFQWGQSDSRGTMG